MKYSNYKISLDIHDGSSQAVVNVKRGDTARRILAVLTENGLPYHITEECTAVFTATKPDGNVMYNDCMIEGCIIIYTLTEQTTAVCGVLDCEFKLYGADGDMLTCPRFSVIVDETVYHDGDEVESTPEYTALTQKMSELTSLIYEVERKLENGEFVGEKGAPGVSPKIGENGNWYVWNEETEEFEDTGCVSFGTSPHIGSNGHWWIGTKDSGISATGPKGDPGDTPEIGENGNWWIGGVDTGVPASGGGGASFDIDNHTLVIEKGILRVNTTNDMEQDNTLPITSAGVYATVGNIGAILDTI